MRISEILERNRDTCPNLPCIIYQEKPSSNAVQEHPAKTESSCRGWYLSYQDAYTISQQHAILIQNRIQEMLIASPALQDSHLIIVAFLAHNSSDLLLAILACMDIILKPRNTTTTTTTTTNIVVPVMLNTRWTFQEIVQALKSHNHDNNNNNSNDFTLMIHDDDSNHIQRVQQAANLLRQINNNHYISSIRLFPCSHSYCTTIRAMASKRIVKSQRLTTIVSNDGNNNNNKYDLESTASHNQVSNNDDDGNNDDDTAIILFTSGTTSGSKGVLLSHRALYLQAMAKLGPPCNYDTNTKMVATTVPLFHVGGLNSTLAVLLAKGCLVFPPSPDGHDEINTNRGFQPDQVLQSIQQKQSNDFYSLSSNTLVVVPAMLSSLLMEIKHKQQHELSTFPSVRFVLIGGQSASLPLLKDVFQYFPNAKVVQTYACTEGASSLTFWERTRDELLSLNDESQSSSFSPFTPTSAKSTRNENHQVLPRPNLTGDCVGFPPSHIELCLFPTTDKNEVNTTKQISESYTPGVIATRGPHLLTGYWRRGGRESNAMAQAITSSASKTQRQQYIKFSFTKNSNLTYDSPLTSCNGVGWFVTNDLGYLDDKGRYYFCGRITDVIRSGGETVLASEVEKVLLRHDQIQECAVFALPGDMKYGETVCAAVVLTNSDKNNNNNAAAAARKPTLMEIRSWCHQQGLAGYKRPRRIFYMTELPRNSSGKLLKRLLVERFRHYNDNDDVVILRSTL